MANRKKSQRHNRRNSKRQTRSRRSIFMRNSAFIVGVLMATSLIGASYYNKTTGHLSSPRSEAKEPSKQPRTHHDAPAKSDRSS